MVAQLKPEPAPLPLLVEPLEPEPQARRNIGWLIDYSWQGRALVRTVTRDHKYDVHGAEIQHIIVRYLVHGISREQIAHESGYSPRQIQTYIQGRAYRPYAQGALRELKALGISSHRGQRHPATSARLLEIIAAQADILVHAEDLLAYIRTPGSVQIRRAIRLLSAGREPVRCL